MPPFYVISKEKTLDIGLQKKQMPSDDHTFVADQTLKSKCFEFVFWNRWGCTKKYKQKTHQNFRFSNICPTLIEFVFYSGTSHVINNGCALNGAVKGDEEKLSDYLENIRCRHIRQQPPSRSGHELNYILLTFHNQGSM